MGIRMVFPGETRTEAGRLLAGAVARGEVAAAPAGEQMAVRFARRGGS